MGVAKQSEPPVLPFFQQPLRINVCYWKAKDPDGNGGAALEQLPCFLGIKLNGEGHDIYGLPVDEYPGLVKVREVQAEVK